MEIYERIYNVLEERLTKHKADAQAYKEAGKLGEAIGSNAKAIECQEIMLVVLSFEKEEWMAAVREKIAAIFEEREA